MVDSVRDVSDVLLARAALASCKPILAICRGEQLMNVVLGGSLYQDLSRKDYDSIFSEIVRDCGNLAPFIENLRKIRPPQNGEKRRLLPLLKKGDTAAREFLHNEALASEEARSDFFLEMYRECHAARACEKS